MFSNTKGMAKTVTEQALWGSFDIRVVYILFTAASFWPFLKQSYEIPMDENLSPGFKTQSDIIL